MKQFITFFLFLVVAFAVHPEFSNAQSNEADFKITGIVETCGTSPGMLTIAHDKEGGAHLAGMLSPVVGHQYGSLTLYHLDENNEIINSKWMFPSDFTPNPRDVYVEGEKVLILIRAVSTSDINVVSMILDKDSLEIVGGGWYPLINGAEPQRMVSFTQALVNHDGQAELWDVSSFDPDPIPLGEESVFSANSLDGSGFGFVGNEGVHIFDLDGVETFYSQNEEGFFPWGAGFTSDQTFEAYRQGPAFYRVVTDYVSGESYTHPWDENLVSLAFGEMRVGLVTSHVPGTTLMGNHTEIWCGQDVYDLKDYIPEIQTGSWVVIVRDGDIDYENETLWLTGTASEFGGPQRFSWYGKVPISEAPLEGIPFVFTDVMNPEKHEFSVYPNPAENTVTVKGYKGKVDVYSQVGERVRTLDVSKETGQQFDISELPNGVYQFYCPSNHKSSEKTWQVVVL